MSNEKNPWTTLSTETKYDNPWIRVDEYQVLNPAGNPSIYGVLHMKHLAIAILPLDEDYNTWIIGQHRFPFNSYEWEVVEGGCPEGTLPLDTAKRELKEEAGLEAKHYELILEMQLSNSKSDEYSYSYIAKGITYTGEEPEEDEQLTIRKIPFSELYAMCMNGTIKDALSIATVLKAKALIDAGKI